MARQDARDGGLISAGAGSNDLLRHAGGEKLGDSLGWGCHVIMMLLCMLDSNMAAAIPTDRSSGNQKRCCAPNAGMHN